jgi:16S rRNA processing protein RimM
VGRIAAIDDSTLNILFELEDGRLIPASDELIHHIDSQQQQIIMDIPMGLLDI